METLAVFQGISRIVWFIPPIRQYKNEYFMFFLLLTIGDLITTFLRLVVHISSNAPYVIVAFLLVMSLQKKEDLKRFYLLELLITAITLIIVLIENDRMLEIYIIGFLQFIILYYILQHFFRNNIAKQTLNLFYVVLVFYQILTVIKFLNILSMNYSGYFYVQITTIFQILIGLFFSFFRPDNPKICFKLTSKD